MPSFHMLPPGMRVYVRLSAHLRGRVGGLCGNFDGDTENDFTTRQGIVESTPELFGNSWKVSPSCPDVANQDLRDPCAVSLQLWNIDIQRKSQISHSFTCWDAFLSIEVEPSQGDLGQEKVCSLDSGALLSVPRWGALPAVLWLVCLWCLWVSYRA